MFTKLIIAATTLALAAQCLAGSKTRTSRFEYDAQGQLIREIIEPDDSNLCLVKTYYPDVFGNRLRTDTRNCNGTVSNGVIEAAAPTGDPVFAPRTSRAFYAAGSDVYGAWVDGQFPTLIANPLLQRETRTYDPRFGGVVTLTGPNNLPTTWRYDSFGQKQSETHADGTVSNFFYERCVDLAGACPSNAQYRVRVTATGAPTKSTYYNSFNREVRTETQGFDGTSVYIDTQYDNRGRVTSVSRPYYAGATPAVTTFSYDVLSRVIRTDEPATSAGQARTETRYLGLVTRVTVSNVVNGASSGTGLPGDSTQIKTTTKNGQGQVVQVKDTQNNSVIYTYDEFGNLNTTTDASGNVTTLTNDLRGRKTQMLDPDMGRWTYHYNALAELIWQCDPVSRAIQAVNGDCADAVATRSAYDTLGRMTSRTERDQTSKWFYDSYPTTAPEWNANLLAGLTGSCADGTGGTGKLCYASADNGYRRLLTYDDRGRPKELNTLVDSAAYLVATTYDSASRVDAVTYPATNLPALAVKNAYNTYGHLLQVQRVDAGGSTVFWRASAKTASGLVTSEALNDSLLTQTRGFDPVDRLSSVVAGTVHNLSYSYDALGNVKQRVDSIDNVTENFSYDTLNRLTIASGPNLLTRSFNYDALGNMTYKSDVGGGTYTYPPSGAGSVRPHAVSSVAGTVNGLSNPLYSYDANGNLTQVNAAGGNPCPTPQAAGERCAAYMSFNMPANIKGKDASGNSTTYTWTYSPEHERVRLVTVLLTGTQTTIYLHPSGGSNLFYEKEIKPDGSLEHKHYINAGAQLVGVYVMKSAYASGDGPQMRYYHLDGIGSVMAISNEAGAPIERLAYEPFGKRRFPNGTIDPTGSLIGITTDRGFTEHEHLDELQLIHMNGRVYDPVLARFMTPDPGVPHPLNLQSFNRYSYALNNPLRNIDPSGFCDEYYTDDCDDYDTGYPTGGTNGTSGGTPGGTGIELVPGTGSSSAGSVDTVGTTRGLGAAADLNLLQASFTNEAVCTGFTGNGQQTPNGQGNDLGLGGDNRQGLQLSTPLILGIQSVGALGADAVLDAAAGAGLRLLGVFGALLSLAGDTPQNLYLYHFTNDVGYQGIIVDRIIVPGPDGYVYLTPTPYQSSTYAQQQLSMSRTPAGYFQIPTNDVGPFNPPTIVQPANGQPGGGLETRVPHPVSIENALWIPLLWW